MSAAALPDVSSKITVTLENAACPRCGSTEGRTVAEAEDFLYGVPGRFFVWECAGCGLQYQNPRPIPEHLPLLYPATYGPHGGNVPSGEMGESAARTRFKRLPIVRSAWPLLHTARSRFRSLRHRVIARISRLGHVSPTQWEAYLRHELGYSHLEVSSSERGRVRRAKLCRRMAGIGLIPHYVPNGRLLEIGCATGDRLTQLRDCGWNQLDGIELAEQAAVQARQKGFPVLCEALETGLDHFPDASFDVVVSSMVLEHLYNPFDVTRAIARKLRHGGQFLFSTVTRDSLDARLFDRYWGGYDFPRHMVYFRLTDIRNMLSDDFELVNSYHQNAPVDFVRPAMWRRPEAKFYDRWICRMAESAGGTFVGGILAWARQTCRVSFRCLKKK